VPGAKNSEPAGGHPIYGISVAAELTGVSPQALRDYESKGLLEPHRTGGGTRRYSRDDVDRIHAISSLLANGANLAAVRQILQLEGEVDRLTEELQAAREVRLPRGAPGAK
jgi:MerR family transcriptional regulator/heat shock protein HspR